MRNRQLFVVNRCIPTKLFPNSSNEKNFLAILLCDSLPNRFPFDHFKKKIVKNFAEKATKIKDFGQGSMDHADLPVRLYYI